MDHFFFSFRLERYHHSLSHHISTLSFVFLAVSCCCSRVSMMVCLLHYRHVFETAGPLKQVSVIRDRVTYVHRSKYRNVAAECYVSKQKAYRGVTFLLFLGCAFLTYENIEDSERAIAMFHNKLVLPYSPNPVQLRLADSRSIHMTDSKVSLAP